MKKIEKLEHEYIDYERGIGYSVSLDDVINKLNDVIDALNGEPELRESEDERMLREFNDYLCEEIECRSDDLRDEKDRRTLNMLCYVLKKVDSWLEKQKENSKSADSISADCASIAKCEDRWYKVQDFTPSDGRLVLAKDNIGNYLLASFAGGEWFVERYDLDDVPMKHTYVVEWCEIPSEKQKEQKDYHKTI